MAEKTYTGASLEKALKDDSLTKSGIVLVGMVKASELGGHIGFTRSGCQNWVDLPVEMIESAEHVGQNACKDHSHPVMKLTLKESKDPAAQILLALLAQSATAPVGPMPSQGGPGSFPQGYPGQGGGGYVSPYMSGRPDGGGMPSPMNSNPQSFARLAGGLGQFPGGGRLNAWGCWSSCCASHCAAGHYEAGPIGWVWVCDWRVCDEPCERCIWPW